MTGPPDDIREISEIQVAYILENLPDAAIYPAREAGDVNPAPVEFVYRRLHLLTRDRDLQDVLRIVRDLRPSRPAVAGTEPTPPGDEEVTHPIPGLALVRLANSGVFRPVDESRILYQTLEVIRQQLGPRIAFPDHVVSVTPVLPPATNCPATEPDWVPADAAPQPGISTSACDGRGVLVAVADTGLVTNADGGAAQTWLRGVAGDPDLEVDEGKCIRRYGGHGLFVASLIRAMAPQAEVRVKRVFERAGALYESDIVRALLSVLDWNPDVISLSAGTHTWEQQGSLSFRVFVDGPLREHSRTVLVAAAGNDGRDWKFAPAEMDEVVGVGALGPPGDARAWFSDYGDWVKVFAPGQDLVHAFARGRYTYHESRRNEPPADFAGMARWSGTSFSTPVVSGLIAARMSGTGETAPEAAESLLELARAQALPGVGPVLRPGQACLRLET
jgi:hypothetical protein